MTVRPGVPEDLYIGLTLVRELAAYERMSDDVSLDVDEFGRNLFGPSPAAHVLIAEDEITGEAVGFALDFGDWNDLGREFYERLGAVPVEGWTRYRWDPSVDTPPR